MLNPHTNPAGADALAALSAEIWSLVPPAPHERASLLRSEAGLLVDHLLTRVARSRGALDVALGEGLAALAEGDRTLRLGYSSIGDYARERLGIAARTAQSMARLGRELRGRPLLRDAVRRGSEGPYSEWVLRQCCSRAAEVGSDISRSRGFAFASSRWRPRLPAPQRGHATVVAPRTAHLLQAARDLVVAGVPVAEAARRKGVARSTLQKFIRDQKTVPVSPG